MRTVVQDKLTLLGALVFAIALLFQTGQASAVGFGPAACAATTTPSSYRDIDNSNGAAQNATSAITISGIATGAAVSVDYRNNAATGSFNVGITRTSGPTISPASLPSTAVSGSGSGTVSFSASGSGTLVLQISSSGVIGGPDPEYRVTCLPPKDVTVSPTSLTVAEAAGTSSFSVVLTSPPSDPVTIPVSSSDTTAAQVSVTSLTFTAATWNVAQVVTVTGVNNDIDEANRTATILTAAATSVDPGYNGRDPSNVSVTVTDDDVAGLTVVQSGGSTSVNEAGATSDTITVRLRSQPTADVTVDVTSSDLTEGTVSPASLTFTAANWSTPQTVTLTAVDDFLDDGNISYSIVLNPASADTRYNALANTNVSARTVDNDTVGFTVTPTSLTVAEAGGTGSFTVVLTSQPSGDVSVGLSSSNSSNATVSPASLTFTAATWNVAQVVTVTGVNNDVDEANRTATILTAAATSVDPGYNGRDPSNVSVTVTDDDVAGLTVVQSGGSTSVNEAGATSDTITVRLRSQPTADVTVDVTSSDLTEGTVSPASLTFTAANWSTPQTVTLTAVDESIDDGDVDFDLVADPASSDILYGSLPNVILAATTVDDDTAGITVTPTSLTVAEAGGTGSFTVVLTSQPVGDVVIGVTPDTQCSITPGSVVFTASTWDQPQDLTVEAIDDAVSEGPHACAISFAVSAPDSAYDGYVVPDLGFDVSDNDSSGLSVSGFSSLPVEGGADGSFSVALMSAPLAEVIVQLVTNAQCKLTPAVLSFSNVDWSVPQSVSVTAVDDDTAEVEQRCEVSFAVSSADPGYDGLASDPVMGEVADNDVAGVVATPASVTVTEEPGDAQEAEIEVSLNAMPLSDVVITLAAADGGEVQVLSTNITFTPGNWNVGQRVTIRGVDDEVQDGNILSEIELSVSGSDAYADLQVPPVAVTTVDDDLGPNETVVQKTFESQTYNFMAQRLKLLAANGPNLHRLIDRQDGAFQSGSNSLELEGKNGDLAGSFALNSSALRSLRKESTVEVMPAADSPPRISWVNVWAEGEFAIYRDKGAGDIGAEGDFFVGYAGVDVRIAEWIILGLMGEVDWMAEDTDIGQTEGTGWMIGPYISAEVVKGVYLDVRGLYGRSSNSSRQDIEGYRYRGDFETERFLIEGIVSGEFKRGGTTLTPDLRLVYGREVQDDYSVSNGITDVDVNGRNITLGQLSLGIRASHDLGAARADIVPYIEGRLFWDFDNPGELTVEGDIVSTEAFRAAVSAGLRYRGETTDVYVDATYDGLLDSDYRALSAKIGLEYRF